MEYAGTVVVSSKKETYKTELETKLSSVQTDLQNVCNNNLATSPEVVLEQTVTFSVTGSKVCISFSKLLLLSFGKNLLPRCQPEIN